MLVDIGMMREGQLDNTMMIIILIIIGLLQADPENLRTRLLVDPFFRLRPSCLMSSPIFDEFPQLYSFWEINH